MNALIESTQELLRFAIAERDAFYDCSTDAEGNLNDPGDQAELERMDAMIDRARAALSDCANDREPPPVNLMFSTGHKDPFNFTASDRRFFVSYPAPPSVAAPEGFEFVYIHPFSKEKKTVVVTGEAVAERMSDYLEGALAEQICKCQPVGETNVVECGCEDYIDAFKLQTPNTPSPGHIADAGKVSGWPEITKMIQDFVAEYEYTDGEGGYYTPTDWQRHMVEDAIHGVLSEVPLQPATPSAPEEEIKKYIERTITLVMQACGNSYANAWCEQLLSIAKRAGVYRGKTTGSIYDLMNEWSDEIDRRKADRLRTAGDDGEGT